MTTTVGTAAVWAPRLAGIGMALFLVPFALASFHGKSVADALPAFLMNLVPALLVAATVAAAWRHPLAGAGGFALFALAYAAMAPARLDWVVAISGPLVLIAALFLLSWRASDNRSAAAVSRKRESLL